MTQTGDQYITLDEAKEQCAVDPGITAHDKRLQIAIGAAIDWAENFTNRSLAELMQLDSPHDSGATAQPTPVDSPPIPSLPGSWFWDQSNWVDTALWTPDEWRTYWAANPIQQDHAMPLRRDAKQAILVYVQVLFDLNPSAMKPLEEMAIRMLQPYRIAMGV